MNVISQVGSTSFMAELRYRFEALADGALSFVLPPTCAGCYRDGTALCRECRPALEGVSTASKPADKIASQPGILQQLEWCAPLTGVAGRAVDRLTAAGDIRLARPLGEAIARHWARAGTGGEVLVPVPATADAIDRRGYDQASLLARAAGRKLHLPVMQVLARQILDASVAAPDAPTFGVLDAARIAGRWVILVDDVVTTGATLTACADALLQAGARAVSAVVVADDRPAPLAAPRTFATA